MVMHTPALTALDEQDFRQRCAGYRCWHAGLVEPCDNRKFRPSRV